MPDILHRVEIKASANNVYRALATREGLMGWWTSDTKGTFDVGGTITFRFGTRGYIEVKIVALDPDKRVLWEVTGGPDEWIGTQVSFGLTQNEGYTIVLFKHQGWKEPVEFMYHCSTKWATFLMSIKALVESGKGAPYPDDVHISVVAD